MPNWPVSQRILAGTPYWGIDAVGMFLPFSSKETAEDCASKWTEEYILSIGGFAINKCPLATDSGTEPSIH